MVLGQRVAKASAAMRACRVASVTDLLGGQVGLDLECMDRACQMVCVGGAARA